MSDVPTSDPGGAPDTGGLSTDNAPATPSGDLFNDPSPDQAVFDRGYVERLRSEGARYRTEHKAAADQLAGYEQVFGRYDPEDRQVWLDLANSWATDPSQAAATMQQIANAVLQPEPATADIPADTPDVSAADVASMTPEQVQQMISEALGAREQQAAEQRAVDEVYSEIRAAGYDPSTKEGFMVLWLANNGGNGDIQAGIKEMQAWRQSIVDDYVSGRANGHHPTPTPANGAVATPEVQVNDLREARKAAQAYIDSQIGASSG